MERVLSCIRHQDTSAQTARRSSKVILLLTQIVELTFTDQTLADLMSEPAGQETAPELLKKAMDMFKGIRSTHCDLSK
jgi:hypothetical protein